MTMTAELHDVPPTAKAPFACHIVGPDHPMADEARALERQVFLEAFGNTPELLDAEYGPYEHVSMFVCVEDAARGVLAGMIRLTFDGNGSLKSLADIAAPPWSRPVADVLADTGLGALEPARTLDITTLAVHPDYRGRATNSTVSFALYQATLTLSTVAQLDWFVTILDVVVLDVIQQTMRNPMAFYAGVEPMRYLDSPASVPVWCDLRGYRARMLAEDPDTYRTFFQGTGLEAAISPPDYLAAAVTAAALTSATVLDITDGAIARSEARRGPTAAA